MTTDTITVSALQAVNTDLALDYENGSVYQCGMGALTKFRERARLSQAALADLVGTSQPQIQRLEAGKRGLSRKWAIRIAPHVGASPEELMFGGRTVAVVGSVGAGSEAHYYAESQGEIGRARVPPYGGSERTVAVLVRGDSLGPGLDGWVIYYDERRDPPTPEMVGQICVCGLASGQVLVKQIIRGRSQDRYDLMPVAIGSPLYDQQIIWAARVTALLPPGLALVEESQDEELAQTAQPATRPAKEKAAAPRRRKK